MGRRAKLGRFFTPPDGFSVLDTVTEKICGVLGAPASVVMFYDAVGSQLVVISCVGAAYPKGTVLEEDGPIIQWLNETTTPLAVNDTTTTQVDRSFLLVPEAKSMLWVPVFVAGHVCGALAVFHNEKNALYGSDVEILDLISTQVASIIELYLRMDEVTVTDFLTGLASQPYFLERVKEEALRSERYGAPVSLVKLVLKPSNPHDTALQRKILPEAAQRLRQKLRRSDIASRITDWSFLVILPETGALGAGTVAARLETEMLRMAEEKVEDLPDFSVESKFVCYPETEPDREQFVELFSPDS